MTPRAVVLLALTLTWEASADSFRGLPYYVKVESLSFVAGANGEPENHVEVCYRFATTVPILGSSELASKRLNGVVVTRSDVDGVPAMNGNPQPEGVEYRLNAGSFGFLAYIKSDSRAFGVDQLQFFNSLIRSTGGVSKSLRPLSFSLTHTDMIKPQYEWVQSCESIPFGKAFTENYVRALFRGPGPIGYLTGSAQFVFNILPPPAISPPLRIDFRESSYSVPVFGMNALGEGDYRMIALSHFLNSLTVVCNNLDATSLNDYLVSHEDVVHAFEAIYGIRVDLPTDAETLVSLYLKVAGIEGPSPDGNGF